VSLTQRANKTLAEFRDRLRPAPAPAGKPKPASNLPIVEREDEDWLLLAKEWRDLDDRIKALESERVAVGQQLAALSPDTSARGGGVNLMRYWQEGRLDTKALFADLKISESVVAKYRSAKRQIVSIRRTAGNK
jgi:hypothetical protein